MRKPFEDVRPNSSLTIRIYADGHKEFFYTVHGSPNGTNGRPQPPPERYKNRREDYRDAGAV